MEHVVTFLTYVVKQHTTYGNQKIIFIVMFTFIYIFKSARNAEFAFSLSTGKRNHDVYKNRKFDQNIFHSSFEC